MGKRQEELFYKKYRQAPRKEILTSLVIKERQVKTIIGAPGWLSRLRVNFDSGHDSLVCGLKPCVRLCVDRSEPGPCFRFCVSLPLYPSSALSLPKINIKK